MSADQEFGRKMRAMLQLPPDAPQSAVLAAVDVLNAGSCARLGLPADTPPAQIRAAEEARREALALYHGGGTPADQVAYAEVFGPVDRHREAVRALREGRSNAVRGGAR